MAETGLDAEVENAVDLLVGYRFRQAKARDLRAYHTAALGVAVEDHAVIAKRRQVARDRQRGRAGAHQRYALAVLLRWTLRKVAADIAFVVGRDPLQPADRDRLLLDAAAAAGRFARAVAGAAENAGKDVRFPVDRPSLAKAAGDDQPNIFRNRRVRRTGPLAIDNLVKIVGITDVGRLQYASPAPRRCARPNALASDQLAMTDSVRHHPDTGRGGAL